MQNLTVMASTAKPKQTLDLSSLSSLTLASMFTGGGGLTLGAGGGGRVVANVARLISAVGSQTRERHQNGLADVAGTFMHQVQCLVNERTCTWFFHI